MRENGCLSVDDSDMQNGRITVSNLRKSRKKKKIKVERLDQSVHYDIDNAPIVIPLQFGHGAYTVRLLENTTGNKYREIGLVRLAVKITKPLSVYLLPNVYVDYTDQSACVKKAAELCNGLWADTDKFNAIRGYINTHFRYNFLRALLTTSNNSMPRINETFAKGCGICHDFAALAAAMLRSQGVPTMLVIGLADNNPHAWVKVYIRNGWLLYDPTKAIRQNGSKVVYIEQRWY